MIVFIEIHVIIVKKRKVNAHYGHSTHEKNKGSMSILFFCILCFFCDSSWFQAYNESSQYV